MGKVVQTNGRKSVYKSTGETSEIVNYCCMKEVVCDLMGGIAIGSGPLGICLPMMNDFSRAARALEGLYIIQVDTGGDPVVKHRGPLGKVGENKIILIFL